MSWWGKPQRYGSIFSYLIKSTYCQHDFSWLTIILLTGLRSYLSGSSTVKLAFFPTFHAAFFGRKWLCAAHIRSGRWLCLLGDVLWCLYLYVSTGIYQEYQSCPADLGPSLCGLVRSSHGCHSAPGCSPKVPLRAWYSDDEVTYGIYSFLSWRLLFESLVSKKVRAIIQMASTQWWEMSHSCALPVARK